MGMQLVPHAPTPSRAPFVVLAGAIVVLVLGSAFLLALFAHARPTATPAVTAPMTGITIHPCSARPDLRSRSGATPTALAIANDTRATMSLFWLDYAGAAVFYKQLAAGESYSQQTYTTHPWLVVDTDGACQGLFVAQRAGRHDVSLAEVRRGR